MKDPVAAQTLRMPLIRVCLAAGEYHEAIAEAEQRLDENPRDGEALRLLCQAQAALQQEDRILAFRLKYAATQPRNFENNSWLADHFEAAGDATQALRFLQGAADCGQGDSTLFLRLAKMQFEHNLPDDMMINLRQARRLALDDDNAAAAAEIEKLISYYAARDTPARPPRR